MLVACGLVARPEPDAPGPFRLSDPERIRELVEDAGLELESQDDAPLTWRYESFNEYWDTTRDLARSLATALEWIDEATAEAIQADVRQALEPYAERDGLAIPALTRVALARRPK